MILPRRERHKENEMRLDDVACSAGVFGWYLAYLGGRNLVRVRIVVVTIFDSMTVEDWGE